MTKRKTFEEVLELRKEGGEWWRKLTLIERMEFALELGKSLPRKNYLPDDLSFREEGFRSEITGLPFYLRVSARGPSTNRLCIRLSQSHRYDPDTDVIMDVHAPRILKGSLRGHETISAIFRFLELNIDAITSFWNEEIDGEDLRQRIKHI
jgi:hypothetical protein